MSDANLRDLRSDKNIVILSYIPQKPKKELSGFQKMKNNYKSIIESKNKYIPKNGKEMNRIRYINLAKEYTELKTLKSITKEEFCKNNKISRDSLNIGLKSLGVEITHKK
jgi:hypothetical protein